MKIISNRRRSFGPKVRLDWRAYYRKFCDKHGEPVPYKNRLLFRDGWGYSEMDYAGPEYPPPKDPEELARLAVAYWKIRAKLISRKLEQVKARMQSVVNLQSQKSLPLQSVMSYYDEETGKRRARLGNEPKSSDLDVQKEIAEHRNGINDLELELELAHCREELSRLKTEEANHVER